MLEGIDRSPTRQSLTDDTHGPTVHFVCVGNAQQDFCVFVNGKGFGAFGHTWGNVFWGAARFGHLLVRGAGLMLQEWKLLSLTQATHSQSKVGDQQPGIGPIVAAKVLNSIWTSNNGICLPVKQILGLQIPVGYQVSM